MKEVFEKQIRTHMGKSKTNTNPTIPLPLPPTTTTTTKGTVQMGTLDSTILTTKCIITWMKLRAHLIG